MRTTAPPAPSVPLAVPPLPAAEGGPAPLTFRTTEGDAFARPADIEAEITAALALDPATWIRMATSARPSPIRSEALVYLCRHLRAASTKRQRLLGDLLFAVEARASRVAQKLAQGFDPVTTEEIVQEVGQKVLELILAGRPDRAAEFLEISFGAAVARWTLKAVRTRRRHLPSPAMVRAAEKRDAHPRPHQKTRDAEGVDGATVPTPEALLVEAEGFERCPEPLRVALGAIRDERHREALILHHLEGWPIADKDPLTLTLCRRFGVSDRQIRTWIATAFADMRQAIGEKS